MFCVRPAGSRAAPLSSLPLFLRILLLAAFWIPVAGAGPSSGDPGIPEKPARPGDPSGRSITGPADQDQDSPTARFWQVLAHGLALQEQAVPSWIPAADSAAARFLAGGRLWAGGSLPDFSGEACGRAGGIMPILPMEPERRKPGSTLAPGDVVLMSFHGPRDVDARILDKLHELDALVLGFGHGAAHRAARARCDAWIETAAPQVAEGAPAAAILTVADLWMFVGEWVAACTRRGRMPTMWQSIMMPGSRARNARWLPLRVHPDLTIPPVAPGRMAAAYQDTLERQLAGFRNREWGRLHRAADRIRRARREGATFYICPLGGHLRPNRMDLPGTVPDGAELSRYIECPALADSLEGGDVIYFQGYTDPPGTLLRCAREAGAFTVLSLAGTDGRPPDRDAADVVLDAQWELGDAVVPLPGYDVPLLPPSGFMAAAIYWALVLDAR